MDTVAYVSDEVHIPFCITDFSLTHWKTNNGLISLSDGDSHLLQEELRISQHLWTYSCSRESDDYFPHTNYWKDRKNV